MAEAIAICKPAINFHYLRDSCHMILSPLEGGERELKQVV